MRIAGRITVALLLVSRAACPQAQQAPSVGGPRPETVRAFDAYVRLTESHLDAQLQGKDGFLWADSAGKRARVRSTGALCEPRNSKGDVKVAGGLIHDWVGSVFIRGATVARLLTLAQDYDNHKRSYKPDVLDSKTLERRGDDFKVRLRLLERKVITVVMDTEYDVHYRPLGGTDWRSRSYSTRIVEIANAGGPRERERTPKEDRGFLWRLNSYWLFRQRDGGVYVECEAVSLSRGVPSALEFLIDPIIRNMPRDILTNTLRATRRLALAGLWGGPPGQPE
jgi:hypothetical protein